MDGTILPFCYPPPPNDEQPNEPIDDEHIHYYLCVWLDIIVIQYREPNLYKRIKKSKNNRLAVKTDEMVVKGKLIKRTLRIISSVHRPNNNVFTFSDLLGIV